MTAMPIPVAVETRASETPPITAVGDDNPEREISLNDVIMPAIVPSRPSSGEMEMIVRRPSR